MKRKLLLLATIVICLAILASGTMAYFTAEGTAHNVITSGSIDITLIEKTQGEDGALVDFPKEGLTGIMPGTSASKIVSVQNTGMNEAWIRVHVEQKILAADGSELPLLIGGATPAISYAVDSSKWTECDGWYYYNLPVAAAAVTDVLFEEVGFAPQMGNEYQGCTANIEILAQAVQSDNNGNAALDAAGWPAA